jgi:hypothetical protein
MSSIFGFSSGIPSSAALSSGRYFARNRRPTTRQTPMRKGPTSPDSPRRTAATSQGDDARAGIRALDCGDEPSADGGTIIRRETAEPAPLAEPTDQGDRSEQRRSV